MQSQAILQIESKTIGSAPQTVAAPEVSGQVVYRHFGITSTLPLTGGVALGDFMEELEGDPDMAPRLAQARRTLANVLDESTTLRRLRLAAGLSQAKLAARAKTTQTYIARVESGTLDPGTDMLARLAAAVGSDEVTVFSAVRNQRANTGLTRVG
jgi:DNA-binding XRE family transcriptional regulator